MVIVDLGCGDGRYLLRCASANPGNSYLGIELIGSLVEMAAARAPSNLRFIRGDAVEWLSTCPRGSIDEVHVYHPQPYYDPAEVHYGMMTAPFFDRLWLALGTAGVLIFQTDNRRYGKYLVEAAERHFDVEIQPGPWPDAPQGRTRRESVAMGKGLPILRAVARRRATPLDIAPLPPYFVAGSPGLRIRRASRKKRGRSG